MTMETIKAKKLTLYQALLERRVPQICGFYLGASWGLIQFIEWVVSRYGLSPYLPDFSLVVLFSLFPSVFLLAYFHGRPGDDDWNRIEKVSIPVNLIFTAALLFTFFSGKNLGAATEILVIQNEDGETIERIVAKSEFRKKIILFDYQNNTGDEKFDWLENGFSFALNIDLFQDPFLDAVNPLFGEVIYNKLKRAGFENGKNAPMALMVKLSQETHYDYFIKGTLSKEGNIFKVSTDLYQASLGKKISTITFSSSEILNLVDLVSLQIKRDLKIPEYQIESMQDLPAKEVISDNLKAIELMVLALEEMFFYNNYPKSSELLSEAVSADESFALAHLFHGLVYANSNQSELSIASIKKSLKYQYKMPEQMQFIAKDVFYLMTGQATKRLALLKMQAELSPDSIDVKLRLIAIYSASKQYRKAIKLYENIQQIDAKPELYLDDIATLWIELNDINQAIKLLKKYVGEFPKEVKGINKLASAYSLQGKDELVRESYERVLLLEPENIKAKINLLKLEEKQGRFDQVFERYHEILKGIEEPAEKYRIYRRLSSLFRKKGQPKKALIYTKKASAEMQKFQSPLNHLINQLIHIADYIKADETEQALSILRAVDKELKPPFDKLTSIGYTSLYIQLEDINNALKQLEIMSLTLKEMEGGLTGIDSLAIMFKAEIDEINKDYEEALAGFQNYASQSPRDTYRFYAVGRIYRKLGKLDEALASLNKQLALTPFGAKTNHEIGLVYLAMDNHEKAKHHFNIAAEIWREAEEDFTKAEENKQQLVKLQNLETPILLD